MRRSPKPQSTPKRPSQTSQAHSEQGIERDGTPLAAGDETNSLPQGYLAQRIEILNIREQAYQRGVEAGARWREIGPCSGPLRFWRLRLCLARLLLAANARGNPIAFA